MSRLVNTGLVAVAALSLSVSVSNAADLDLPVIEHTPEIKVESGGGFYLRGDIGYSIWKDASLRFDNPAGGFSNPFVNESSENAFLVGGGVGYQFKKYLRVDLTGDIRTNKDVEATSLCGACVPGPIEDAGFNEQTQVTDLDLYTFFANLYIEPIKLKGFTPYIGGGVGFAYVNYGDYYSLNNPTTTNIPNALPGQANNATVAAINPSNVQNQRFNGENEFRFAWNLQAGASYDLTDNLAVDGSYRYVQIADGNVSNIFSNAFVRDDGLSGHEVRLGLRYTFGGGHKETHSNHIFK